MYSVKEIFYTLQGEGANAGRQQFFAASQAVTSGAVAKRTDPRPSANSAIPTS